MRRLLFNSWQYKLFSLALAIVFSLYIYYFGNYQVQANITLPLAVQNLVSDLALTERLASEVRLTVSGTPQELNALKRSHLRATLDLAALSKPGTYVLNPILPDLLGVELVGSIPAMTVRLERRQERQFKVEITHQGTLAAGYVLSEESVRPESVTVTGPEGTVQQVEHVTATVILEGQVNPITQAVPLMAADADYAPMMSGTLRVVPNTVHYTAEVKPVANAKAVRVVPVLKGEPEVGYTVSEITIEPSQILLDKALAARYSLESISTREIDLSGRTRSFSTNVALNYPFTRPSDAPSSVQVKVTLFKVESGAANVMNLTVELKNRRDGFAYLVRPSLVSVESDGLAELTSEERMLVRASVDVSALEPGVYRLVPTLLLPSSVQRVRLRPQTVELSVQMETASEESVQPPSGAAEGGQGS